MKSASHQLAQARANRRRKLAKRLGLETSGERQGTGAGKGTYTITFAKNVTYNLRGVDVPVESSCVIDLSGQPAIVGRDIAGILGYDFFARYVVEVDYDAAVLTLHDPKAFEYAGRGEAVPLVLEKHRPMVRAKIAVAGKPAAERTLLVDSGSEDAVDDDVLGQSPQRLEIVGGVGLGQEFRTTLGRADSLEIAGYVLQRPFGATGGVPLIGTEVMRRFHLVFDYAHSRIFFEPDSHLGDPFLMDASGLDLRWAKDGFDVHDVASSSAASDAAVKTGDKIVAVNGQPASAFTLEQMNKLLTESGGKLHLTIRRENESREVTLVLRQRL